MRQTDGRMQEKSVAPLPMTYREKKQEAKMVEQIILDLDNGNGQSAQARLDKLRGRDARYYYLYSEAVALQEDFARSDELGKKALDMPENREQWLWGAVYHRLAENAKQQGKRKSAAAYYLRASQHKDFAQGKAVDYSNYLFNLHFEEYPAQDMLTAARGYEELFVGVKRYEHNRDDHEKLRIGYISPDFCRHIVACFSQAFISSFDKDHFSVYVYADCQPDDVTEMMMEYPVSWRNVYGKTAADKAEIIFQDEIDILVDLSGHTGHNALPVMAYKPAPVQISGIGYFATTGLAAVDYFLADSYTALPEEDEFFTEHLLRLPRSHLCYTPLRKKAAFNRIAPCLQNGYVTIGTMNQLDKVTDEMLDLWAKILQQVPLARLCLKSSALDKPYRLKEMHERLRKAGISPSRVELQGYTENYWQFYEQIDIALDTYPYPGGGSTCDALYMGVPVVSLYGRHHHQRFGYSLLKNAGLGAWAVNSKEEYIKKVVALATDRKQLISLQENIAAAFCQTAVMDKSAYMRDLETLYQQIWRANVGRFDQLYQQIKKNYEYGKFAKAAEIGELIAKTIPIPQDKKMLFYVTMGMSYLRAGNWQSGWRYVRQAMETDNLPESMDEKRQFYSNALVFLHFIPDLPDEEMFSMHRDYGKLFADVEQYVHKRERYKVHKKIKIGYLSPDFYEHIVTNFAIQLYSAYNRERFEVHLYNTGGTHNTVTEWLAGLADGWHDLHGRSAADIAAQIYADEIDILVDLAGHTKGGLTLRAMAYKPAPVQLSGIGYFNTTGLPAVDYYITDGNCDPLGNERFFTEKLLRLPNSHFCYTPSESVLHCRAEWKLHNPIVFGSFSNFFKINEDILRIWQKIMQKVPGSRLLLKNVHPVQKELDNLQEKMMAMGFDMNRVELRLATQYYLDEYADMDIALDPYPYPGGGTTCEAIYMGVPVISMYGCRHGSRFGYSLLKNIGLDELAVQTPEKYVEIAVALAESPELLQGLHENLRKMLQASPVMDVKKYLSDIQTGYEKIYKEWLAKE